MTLLNCIILHGERLLEKLGACLSLLIVVVVVHTINNYLPIDVQFKKKLFKMHSCINNSNKVVKSISLSSIQQSFSTFGEKYRYLCHKYKIMHYMFRSESPFIIKQMHLYVDDHHGPQHEAVMVRELCIAIDETRFTVFTADEMCHLVEYVCTIIYYLYSYVQEVQHNIDKLKQIHKKCSG